MTLEKSLGSVHDSWKPLIHTALDTMDRNYLADLQTHSDWLPGEDKLFAAFSRPLSELNTILIGESPYPRAQSANGYAFWDNAVDSLWSDKGLSKPVNRATSLRNFMKMLLVGQGYLTADDVSQDAIRQLDKSKLIQTGSDLFNNMLDRGFLLLNASLVLSEKPVAKDAKAWRPFMGSLLKQLQSVQPKPRLLLMGNISKVMNALPESQPFEQVSCEHPYNVSFIHNNEIIQFFKPLALLNRANA